MIPKPCPQSLLDAHRALDDTLEKIYIGRPFKNDTERLEHLFKLYEEMTSGKGRRLPMPDFVHVTYGQTGASQKQDAMGMRAMQARAYAERGSQYLLVKAPPASGKSRALMFIGLDKLHNQGSAR